MIDLQIQEKNEEIIQKLQENGINVNIVNDINLKTLTENSIRGYR